MSKLLEKIEDIPAYTSILSGESPDQQFTLKGQLSRGLIVLQTSPEDSAKSCILLVTNRLVNNNAIRSVVQRCAAAGFNDRTVFEADETLIRDIYSDGASTAGITTESISEETSQEKYFDEIILDAFRKKASDIHFLPRKENVKIGYRIHGDIYIQDTISHETATELVYLMYGVLADNGSTQATVNQKKPQDAKISRWVNGRLIELRYSHAPAFPAGTHVVLRLLGGGKSLAVNQLGFEPAQVSQLEAIMSKASGLVVLAGTTGSGKSTTIKALLEDTLIKSGEKKMILTAEDPPEYQMDFPQIIQSPIIRGDDDKINPFSAMVASMLRRDPDIAVIGEVRDPLTADSAKDAVQSGHLTVCTVHAESALGIPGRLFSQGIGRDVLGAPSFIAGLVYQKLLPVLCDDCAVPIATALKSGAVKKVLFDRIKSAAGSGLAKIRFRGDGCQSCAGIGVTHQTVCSEIVVPDYEITRAIGQGDDLSAFEHWVDAGRAKNIELGVTVMDHAIYKMKDGIVSPTDIESRIERLGMQATREGGRG